MVHPIVTSNAAMESGAPVPTGEVDEDGFCKDMLTVQGMDIVMVARQASGDEHLTQTLLLALSRPLSREVQCPIEREGLLLPACFGFVYIGCVAPSRGERVFGNVADETHLIQS